MNNTDPTLAMLLDHGTAILPVDDPRRAIRLGKYAAWRARHGFAVAPVAEINRLADFITDELAAELHRRADKPSQERP